MNPLLAVAAISFRKEIRIALISLGVIVSLPFFALFSVTNVAALQDQTVTLYTAPISPTNGYAYDFGFCANTWDDNARTDGYLVDHSPAVGAILQTDAGPLGHVAYVESVDSDSWTVSEMNVKGWDELDSRTLPAGVTQQYNFIH
jgi:hypothetical protein